MHIMKTFFDRFVVIIGKYRRYESFSIQKPVVGRGYDFHFGKYYLKLHLYNKVINLNETKERTS